MTDALYHSIAALGIALAAWDAARRYVGKRASDDQLASLRKGMEALKERNDAQVTNLIAEVKDLLAKHDTKTSAAIASGNPNLRGVRGAR